MKEVTMLYNNGLLEISWSRGELACLLEIKQVQKTLKKVRRSKVGVFVHNERTCRDIVRDFTEHPNGIYTIGGNTTCFLWEKEWAIPTSCCDD